MTSGAQARWYLQLDGETRGPFPSWQLTRYLLLQRLTQQSLVSRDGNSWLPLAQVPELLPEKRLGNILLSEQERVLLENTRAWVEANPQLFYTHPSVQGVEAELLQESVRYHLQPGELPRHNRFAAYAIALVLVLVVVAIPFLLPSGTPPAEPQCDEAAAPGVNWSNCLLPERQLQNSDLSGAMLRNTNLRSSVLRAANLSGADLAYSNLSQSILRGANLQGAQLMGANLQGSELQSANLTEADLSYADLSGANLQGARLDGARLAYTIIREGVVCMPQSVGRCIPGRKAP